MILISDWLESQSKTLQTDISDLRYLVCHLLSKNTAWLFANQNHPLNQNQVNQLNQWANQLTNGKPLAYITGEKAFWTLNLKVNEHTLIPRPETELLIETVEQMGIKPNKILDLGTGSGAIALALATLFPQAKIVASDISIDALQVAQENAVLNQISHVHFIHSDWFSRIDDDDFDLIISNPPYIDADDDHLKQLTHEPISALVADNHGLAAYQTICSNVKNYIAERGILMFEHGWQQHQDVAKIMTMQGFKKIQHQLDLLGHQRITWGIME